MRVKRTVALAEAHGAAGFTLAEVLISTMLSALLVGGIIYGYMMTAKRAEWSSYSLAAESLAQQRLEQMRSCKWDLGAWPIVDELVASNFPPQTNVLDIPISRTNIVWATNFTTITQVGNNPPLRCIRVDCVWDFMGRRLFTNTVVTFRSPDTF
jgi:Tfp pilus assembly protein PilV